MLKDSKSSILEKWGLYRRRDKYIIVPQEVKSLKDLVKRIKDCNECKISENTKNKTIGKGSKNPRVLFVGLNPGKAENETGVPFVGPSGKLLDKWIKFLGLDNNNCAVINLIKCFTPNASLLNGDEFEKCRHFYDAQVELEA